MWQLSCAVWQVGWGVGVVRNDPTVLNMMIYASHQGLNGIGKEPVPSMILPRRRFYVPLVVHKTLAY